MSSKKEREDFRKWAEEMKLGKLSDETCQSTLRGPLRDFLVNFAMKRARSDGYISTVQANLLVNSKTKGSLVTDAELRIEKDLESEIAKSMFAEKEIKKQEEDLNNGKKLEQINEMLRRDVPVSETRWDNFELIVKLLNNYDQRLQLCETLQLELRRTRGTDDADHSRALTAPIEVPQDCYELLKKLSAVAHHAFEDKIVKHFKTPESQAGNGSIITAEEFNSMITGILEYPESAKVVSKWVESERQSQLQILAELKDCAANLEGMNIKQKVDQLIDKWSGLHIEMHQKNEARKVELAEVANKLGEAVNRMETSQAGLVIGKGNVNMLVEKLKAENMILACREFEKDANPRNAFSRVSIVATKDIEDSFPEIDPQMPNSMLRESEDERAQWIEALEDGEVAELTQVLKKTWPQQLRAFEELKCTKERNNQLPMALLKAQECIKLTQPKPIDELLLSMSGSKERTVKKSVAAKIQSFVGVDDTRASDVSKTSGSSSSGFDTTMFTKENLGFDELYNNLQQLKEVVSQQINKKS